MSVKETVNGRYWRSPERSAVRREIVLAIATIHWENRPEPGNQRQLGTNPALTRKVQTVQFI